MINRLTAALFFMLVASLDPRAAFSQEYFVDLDLELTEFTSVIGLRRLQGYQPISLSAHQAGPNGSLGQPLMQVVWRQDHITDWAAVTELTFDQYQTWSADQAAMQRRPICVSAYGFSGDEKYAALWGKDEGTGWFQRLRMTEEEYEAELVAMDGIGFRPIWVSVVGTPTQPRFAAVWFGDLRKSCNAQGLFQEAFNENIINNRMIGCRLICSAAYGSDFVPRFGGIWAYGESPPWEYSHFLSKPELNAKIAEYSAQGYRPTFVSSYDTFEGIRYTASWEAIDQTAIWRMTGPLVPSLSNLDSAMNQFMIDRHVPNASLAVVKNGRLVFARGYTNAPNTWPTTTPTSLFRIASLSKPLTSVGIMKLIESGLIQFDQSIATILDTSGWTDPRINSITVRDLLQHRGGWDVNAAGFDPMTQDLNIASALQVPLPLTTANVIDYMKAMPLDHNPGEVFAYSNFGYCLAGRVIEMISGAPYDAWIKANVLNPVAMQRAHIGRSELGSPWTGEVPYVDEYQRVVPSVMGPSTPDLVPLTYGGWNLSLHDSGGGWVTTAVDYARFAATFDDLDKSPLLSRSSIEQMWSRPPSEPIENPSYYAAGFLVYPYEQPGHYYVSHTGAFNGTSAWMTLRDDHVQWVAFLNVRGISELPSMADLSGIIDQEIDAITDWPNHNIFAEFGVPDVDTFVNVLLGTDADPAHLTSADLNADGRVDARDISGFVQTATGW